MVEALIIGQRKSGTTWLYENFKKEKDINVSSLVKESNFFSKGTISTSEYHKLFPSKEGTKVEVDSSILSEASAVDRIKTYNPNMKVIIILREPTDYLISRINHSHRKGELNYDSKMQIEEFFMTNDWLLNEIDLSHVKRFQKNFSTQIILFEELKKNSDKVYNTIMNFILEPKGVKFVPQIKNPINQGRQSSMPLVTEFYTKIAKFLRKRGFHKIVNLLKNSYIRRAIESKKPRKLFSEEEIINYLKKSNKI